MTYLLVILVVLLGSTAIFLASELIKKFENDYVFDSLSGRLVTYDWPGCDALGRQPGMGNIVIKADQPFAAKIGFNLKLPIFGPLLDYYGGVRSSDKGMAVVSTYLGRGAARFQFLVNCDVNVHHVHAESCDYQQGWPPDVSYPPHWWQTLGFFS